MNKITKKLLNGVFILILILGSVPAHVEAQDEVGSAIQEFPVGSSSYPREITTGPDGSLWFTEDGGIGRMTLQGDVTHFPVCSGGCYLGGITSGPDGQVWFTKYDNNKIGRMTLEGVITEFSLPTPDSYPHGITLGPDGNLWFTDRFAIGKITPEGIITEFALLTPSPYRGWITNGPDGNLWFTDYYRVGYITPQGIITEFPALDGICPNKITSGPDGNLWFTNNCGNSREAIGRITPQGDTTMFAMPEISSPTPDEFPPGRSSEGITLGPDGNLWFTESNLNLIAKITPQGVFSEYSLPTHYTGLYGITVGPDGNLWFTDSYNQKIGRISIVGTGNFMPKLDMIITPISPVQVNTTINFIARFTDANVGDSHNATWDWGDGTTSQGNVTETYYWFSGFGYDDRGSVSGSHTYTAMGVFAVSLTVEDSTGASTQATVQIKVDNTNAVQEFSLGPSSHPPIEITVGPDGNLWFTEYNGIGRITTQGVVTHFPVCSIQCDPNGITLGPDGAVWFIEYTGNKIGRITPDGVITEFIVPTRGAYLREITTGSDGNLWFTEINTNKIGRITPEGAITEFVTPTPPSGITSGPDGNLWFTGAQRIGMITIQGSITEYPTPGINPIVITSGPDGNLWFTDGWSSIGRITTQGEVTVFQTPTTSSNYPMMRSHPYGITTGPDGNLWFTEQGSSFIGRITPQGIITEYSLPTPNSSPMGITTDAYGNLWFTEINSQMIGRIVFASEPVNVAPTVGMITAPADPVQVNTAINFSANFTDTNLGDTHTATWDWGDGTTAQGIVTETNGSGDVSGDHTYTAVGDYTVSLTVMDNNDGSAQATAQITVVNTPSGSNVSVSPGSDISMDFTNVSSPGNTTVTVSAEGPTPSSGFILGNTPTYYDISTTATYDAPVTVCISYDPTQYSNPNDLHLMHYESNTWVDVTTSTDTINHIICGQVNSLSPFVVAQRIYNFTGFFQPVDNLPTLNVMQGGAAVPVKFRLGGNHGLSIFAVGYPASRQITCDTAAPLDIITMTVTAGSSSLTYDTNTGQYTYVWKTDKAWGNTCRQLVLKLNDGSIHLANFKFK